MEIERNENEPPGEFDDAGSLGERGIGAPEHREDSTHGDWFPARSRAWCVAREEETEGLCRARRPPPPATLSRASRGRTIRARYRERAGDLAASIQTVRRAEHESFR